MTDRRTLLVAGLTLIAWILPLAGAAEKPSVDASQARIVDVTVYADRAEVTREAKLQLTAGPNEIHFPRIPWGVERDSLRVSASGVPSSIGSIDLFKQAHEAKKSDAWQEADQEVRRIEQAHKSLRAQGEVHKQMRDFLGSIKATTTEKQNKELAAGRMDLNQLRETFRFLKSGLEEVSAAQLDIDQQYAKLNEDLQLAKARRQAAGNKGTIRSRVAAVKVDATRAGGLTVRLTYTVPGARWKPTYRASLDPSSGQVRLDTEAMVTQQTGEDWENVNLVLSTAAPSRGVKPPWLNSKLLRVFEIAPENYNLLGRVDESVEMERGRRAPSRKNVIEEVAVDDQRSDAHQAPPPPQEASTATSVLLPSGYNARFQPAGRIDVPQDGREHHVLLATETLDSTLAYRTSPSLAAEAFVLAITKSPRDYPLLPGVMRVIVEGSLVGSHRLKLHGPDAELLLPFGVDKAIEVKHIRLPQEKRQKGLRGKYQEISYAYETTLENHRTEAVTVATEEALPVAEDARIEVTVDDETTSGWTEIEDRPGILKWPVSLQPGEKKTVRFAYTIRYPSELRVSGLPN